METSDFRSLETGDFRAFRLRYLAARNSEVQEESVALSAALVRGCETIWSIMSGRWDSGCNIKDVRKPSQSNRPDFLKRWSAEGDFLHG